MLLPLQHFVRRTCLGALAMPASGRPAAGTASTLYQIQVGKWFFQLPAFLISSWLVSLSTPARTSTSYQNTPQAQIFMVSEDQMPQVVDYLD